MSHEYIAHMSDKAGHDHKCSKISMKTDQQPLDQGLKNRCTAFLVSFSVTSLPPATHPPLPWLEVNNPRTKKVETLCKMPGKATESIDLQTILNLKVINYKTKTRYFNLINCLIFFKLYIHSKFGACKMKKHWDRNKFTTGLHHLFFSSKCL